MKFSRVGCNEELDYLKLHTFPFQFKKVGDFKDYKGMWLYRVCDNMVPPWDWQRYTLAIKKRNSFESFKIVAPTVQSQI